MSAKADRAKDRALDYGLRVSGYHVDAGDSRERFLEIMGAYYDFQTEYRARLRGAAHRQPDLFAAQPTEEAE